MIEEERALRSADARRYATRDELGRDEGYEEIELPSAPGVVVRVRYIEQDEITRMTLLPDLAQVTGIIARQQAAMLSGSDDFSSAELLEATGTYQRRICHLSVLDPEADPYERARCDECGFDHPRSLWDVRRCLRLKPNDVEAICSVALLAREVEPLVPFSTGPTPPSSPNAVESSA